MSIIEQIATQDHALTVSELSKYLQLGKTAIYDMMRRRAIPHIRIGYSVRFDPAEIEAWLRKRLFK